MGLVLNLGLLAVVFSDCELEGYLCIEGIFNQLRNAGIHVSVRN